MSNYIFTECRICEFTAIYSAGSRPISGFTCALCAEDNGRDVRVSERPARKDDRAEYDMRKEAPR